MHKSSGNYIAAERGHGKIRRRRAAFVGRRRSNTRPTCGSVRSCSKTIANVYRNLRNRLPHGTSASVDDLTPETHRAACAETGSARSASCSCKASTRSRATSSWRIAITCRTNCTTRISRVQSLTTATDLSSVLRRRAQGPVVQRAPAAVNRSRSAADAQSARCSKSSAPSRCSPRRFSRSRRKKRGSTFPWHCVETV